MDGSWWLKIRQRKVVQWGLAYLAGAWVVLEAGGFVAEHFAWAPWIVRAGTILLGLGLLPALVVAWYHGEKGSQSVSRTEVALLVPLLLVCVGVAFWGARPITVDIGPVPTAIAYDLTRIAVLPFEDFSQGQDQGFLGNGIAEALLQSFTRLEGLQVIARTSSFAYRGRDIASVARDLEVGTVLEGSVQRDGDRLRVTAQLIRTADQSHIWSLAFDRTAGDIFAIQDEIAERVVNALLETEGLAVGRRDQLRTTPEVYDLYLRARQLWQDREPADLRRSVELLESAIELDPEFGSAYSELATALHLLVFSPQFPQGTQAEMVQRIEWAVARALELDPDDAQAYAVRGNGHYLQGRTADARKDLERALSLRPNDTNILNWLAFTYDTTLHFATMERLLRRAVALNPMYIRTRASLSARLQVFTNPAEAKANARQTVRLFPESSLAWHSLIETYSRTGDHDSAILSAVDALEHVDDPFRSIWLIANSFNMLADIETADRWWVRVLQLRHDARTPLWWYPLRDDDDAYVAWARAAQQQSENQNAQYRLGRAYLLTGRYLEARGVYADIIATIPDPIDPDYVSWAQLLSLAEMVGLLRLQGDMDRAGELYSTVESIIRDIVEVGWPQGEAYMMFLLDSAAGRDEAAARWLHAITLDPVGIHGLVEKHDQYAGIRKTEAGLAYIERGRRQREAQLQRLRDAGIPWLFEPELLDLPVPRKP